MYKRDPKHIVVVGLGYVGAPLAIALQKHYAVTGYDINQRRIEELKEHIDHTNEIPKGELVEARWNLTSDPQCLHDADVIIVTVPTPVTQAHTPDLKPVIGATTDIAKYAKDGVTIIYESTVYPGVTEDICVPILERTQRAFPGSKPFKYKENFWVAYSPERINPGDKIHTLYTTTKIVSGDTEETLNLVDSIYSKVTKTFRATTIKVAEAAKVIENTQRDVEIGLMNELANIFGRIGVDTNDVIAAASTKWNFNKYTPGFVGGHCISVDPYYLAYLSEAVGYVPSLILAAREVNEKMPALLALRTVKEVNRHNLQNPVVTVLGITFKENVPDIRNSKAVDLVRELRDFGIPVQVHDPHANSQEVEHEYGITLTSREELAPANAIVLAVAHEEFVSGGWENIASYAAPGSIVVADVKGVLDRNNRPERVTLVRP